MNARLVIIFGAVVSAFFMSACAPMPNQLVYGAQDSARILGLMSMGLLGFQTHQAIELESTLVGLLAS